ncbi:MAG: flagellar hook-basal body complex protein [Roseburia sp.]|nr:flagellar hook-basal body complex protein [Roseburia sp.]MCM1096974.1 flagellar hook-basal body complex protein [Ruminococcus flavefaciens]
MMRSLYSGVAGLRTHQTKMDVIGNNIANVNTTAFKASSIVFNELMSQMTQRASGPNATTGTGGTNARQIGLGVKSGAININITGQGSTQSTGNPFDIMINGDNFFVVNNGQENFFTRDGSFYVDGGGNLAMTSTGYNVMGWQVDEETGNIKKDTVSALRIMSTANLTYPPEATTKGYMAGILDKHDTDVTSSNGKVVNMKFFDALGYSYTAKFVFRQSDDVNNYSLELQKILDSTGAEVDLSPAGATSLFGTPNTLQEKAAKVIFDKTNYIWDNTGKLSTGGKVVADVTQLYNADGTLKAGDEKITLGTGADAAEVTVQEQLDQIAKAYGYEGSTEDFLNLVYNAPNDADDPDAGVTRLTIADMLYNLSKTPAGVEEGEGATLPTFQGIAQDSKEETSFETTGRYFEGITVSFNGDTGYLQQVGSSTTNFVSKLNLSALGGNFSDIEVDLSKITLFDNKGTSTVGGTNGDLDGLGAGRRLGDMIGVSVQQNGMIYANYDNGMTRLLGQIATAAFANASGLEKKGDNLYAATLNSGEFDGIGDDITANGGYMSTGQLEMSNVDLSQEFTEMITTQRGFQANSRIITVSDTLLEELTNLKR